MLLFHSIAAGKPKYAGLAKKERETKMTKRNMLLVSLLLVFGLGVMVPAALAQAPTEGNGTIINVAPSLYTLRPNSIGDADGAVFLNFSSGFGTIAGGEIFTITYSKPIVGASTIHNDSDAATDFCDDANATGIAGAFCSAMTFTASGNTLTLTNHSTPIAGWTGGYITIWGTRVDTVGLVPGSFVTATVGAALNQSYPISFSTQGATVAAPVNVGLVANTASGGSVTASSSGTTVLTCVGGTGSSSTVYFSVDVGEQWAGAWTSFSDEISLAPFAPTSSHEVTNGSDISITLTGIPEGVTVNVYSIDNDTGSQTWGEPSPLTYTGAMANDSVTFEFPLASTVRQELEATSFEFQVITPGAIATNNPPMQASVTLNPTTPTSSVEYPAFTYPIGSLAAEPNYPLAAVTFIGCQTSLLFPYVTNLAQGAGGGALGNWDTGLQISNTTSDPFGPPTDDYLLAGGYSPQVGSCTWYVYHAGTTTASNPTPTTATPITFTRPLILSGGTDAFMLSSTPAAGVQAGYAIAVCNFLGAVGQAGMADNTGIGDWQVMESYLPYVIPNPYLVGRTWDAILGEFAITPFPYFDFLDGSSASGALRNLKQKQQMLRRHK